MKVNYYRHALSDAGYRERYRDNSEGYGSRKRRDTQRAVATYIPELSKVDPHQLGICLYPLKGDKICLGDYDARFTMQSVSKVIMLIVALEVCGLKQVFKKVGAEPSGEALTRWLNWMSMIQDHTIR